VALADSVLSLKIVFQYYLNINLIIFASIMELLVYTLAILISFYMLAQVTDGYFIPALERIAEKNNISSDVAGTTLMAMGSSAPELFIALIAVFRPGGHEAIGIGTIVGSALFNILVIIGATALARKAILSWQPVLRDVLFYIIGVGLLAYVFHNNHISVVEASILILLYVGYIFSVMRWKHWFPYKDDAETLPPQVDVDKVKKYKMLRYLLVPFDALMRLTFPAIRKHWGVFTIAIIWISLLSWVLVESAIHVSYALNVPEAIIALTVLAIGTSVPDLISSYIVAKNGKGGMAVSNAIGSNIFDVLIGLGVPWLIALVFFGRTIEVVAANFIYSVMLLFGSVILVFLLIAFSGWKLYRQTGIILIGVYVAYLLWQIYGVLG